MFDDDVQVSLIVIGLVTVWILFHTLRRPAPPGKPPATPSKTGFTGKRAEAYGRLDAIVIGSGPGGLGVAAVLARRGKKVLILEANEALGGGLHTWEEHGCPFETGFHYLGEVHCESGPLRRIVDYLAPGLCWASMADCPHAPGIYDEVTIGGEKPICLKLRPGEGAWASELIRAFPGEEKAVRRFLELCKQSTGVFLPGVIWRSISSPTLSRWLKRMMTAGQRPFQVSTVDQALAPVTSDRQLVGALSYVMVSLLGAPSSPASGGVSSPHPYLIPISPTTSCPPPPPPAPRSAVAASGPRRPHSLLSPVSPATSFRAPPTLQAERRRSWRLCCTQSRPPAVARSCVPQSSRSCWTSGAAPLVCG